MHSRAQFLGWCLMLLTPSLFAGDRNPERSLPAADPGALNVLVFWSAYCGNCAQVLEGLEEVRSKFSAAPVRFYSVNIDAGDTPTPARATQALAARFEALDPADLLSRHGVAKVPWVLITRRDGGVVATPSLSNHPTAVPAYVEMELTFRGLANARGTESRSGPLAGATPVSTSMSQTRIPSRLKRSIPSG